ncbi:WbqC family protein [Psychroflexus sp. CAK1W]|uniref:WbqC family protein n=1 Tax=Psychroflexus curvus TaxID=2873595 RepID=UPI001CC9053B|nr:WbqC family protein [Psychroflexus curvus]MBZ9628896.1 WbqC family protein [Psychroflexus curvus]
MQPYIFPYIGYFQLIKAVDEFVFYDDVNFIKQGWINRNQILNKGKSLKFTIPLEKPSSFRPINETKINLNLFAKWKHKFLKTIEQTYVKAPHFDEVYPLVEEVLKVDKETNISKLAIDSNLSICNFLDITTKFYRSSEDFRKSENYFKEERLIGICKQLKASRYINSLGGQDLYSKIYFQNLGIELQFLKPNIKPYKQFENNFVTNLSIIDILMFNDKNSCQKMLNDFELL